MGISREKQKGFTLIELLITMGILIMIVLPVTDLIVHYAHFSQTEQAQMRLNQESRFLLSSFASELKSAGCVLSFAGKKGLFSEKASFTGVFPLNNSDYPDGIIVATGDPQRVSYLEDDYKIGDGLTFLVDNLGVDDDGDPATPPYPWDGGDVGILVGEDGYYVFEVKKVDASANTMTITNQTVYYSTLLASDKYSDEIGLAGGGTSGLDALYKRGTPVIRLIRFGIYMFKEKYDKKLKRNIRQLVRVANTLGAPDPLGTLNDDQISVVSENIWDMQISYTGYPDFPDVTTVNHYLKDASTNNDTYLGNLITALQEKEIKMVHIQFVVLTDEFGGAGERILTVPAIKDQASYQLPSGKYSFRVFSLDIELRNYNLAKGL